MKPKIKIGSGQVCVRWKTIKTMQVLGAMAGHGCRTFGNLDHVDTERSHLNRFYLGAAMTGCALSADDLVGLHRRYCKTRNLKLRKGASVSGHVLLIADRDKLSDPTLLEAWVSASIAWLEQTWPGQVIAARLDLDETSPHLDAFVVPWTMQKHKSGSITPRVSVRSGTRGQNTYRALQSSYACAMAHLGFSRGKPKATTGAFNIAPGLHRKRVAEAEAAIEAKKVAQDKRAREQMELDVRLRAEQDRLAQIDAILKADRLALSQQMASVANEVAMARKLMADARQQHDQLVLRAEKMQRDEAAIATRLELLNDRERRMDELQSDYEESRAYILALQEDVSFSKHILQLATDRMAIELVGGFGTVDSAVGQDFYERAETAAQGWQVRQALDKLDVALRALPDDVLPILGDLHAALCDIANATLLPRQSEDETLSPALMRALR
jgi:hypothetical protein